MERIMTTKTSHSEYGKIIDVYVKPVDSAFQSQQKISQEWSDLNYLGEPDFKKAIQEYDEFHSILKNENINVHQFSPSAILTLDSMYCRDASIVTDFGIVLCQMGKQQRQQEPKACESDYINDGFTVLGKITGKGQLEGGDVAWIDDRTLAVANGYRTNDEGFRQLSALLNPHGIETMQVDLPHYKGTSDVFHLMSIFSPIDKKKAVVYSPLMPVRFRKYLLDRGFQLIEVPDEEFESMGCNVLAVAPSKCIMVKGNPITKQRILNAGCSLVEYDGQEISVKGGGGPTCLTRPLRRCY
jgi:N-dimethylarginine dimethylaminohydrolase